MPFTPYRNVLSPYDLAAAQEAFDSGLGCDRGRRPHDTELAWQLLAKLIMQAIHAHGARDAERLKAYALKGFKP